MTGELFGILASLCLESIGPILWSAFLWGLLGLVVWLLVYVVVTRKRWLGPAAPSRWARWSFLAVLLLFCTPSFATAGAVGKMGDVVADAIAAEVSRVGIDQGIGRIAIAPAAILPTLLDSKAALDTDAPVPNDVSFLLDPASRSGALAALAGLTVHGLLQKANAGSVMDSALGAWLRDRAILEIADLAKNRIEGYDALLAELKPDSDGRLSLESASQQVGARLVAQHITGPAVGLFAGMRTKLLLLSVLVAAFCLFALRTVGRLIARRKEADQAPPAGSGS